MDWTPPEVKALRAGLRRSVDEFASYVGVADKSVRNWESGKHRPLPASKRQLDRTYERLTPEQRRRFDDALTASGSATTAVSREQGVVQTAKDDPAARHSLDAGSALPLPGADTLSGQLWDVDLGELSDAVIMWAQREASGLSRREALSKLSMILALAAVGPTLGLADQDERRRIAGVLREPYRLDQETLGHTEDILLSCRRQGDALGPEVALQTALAQRQLMTAILSEVPPNLRPRALSLYAELSQLTGWTLFNLGDYNKAQHYLDEARVVAHEAENADLVTYVLCTMSHLATWRGMPRVGIDHAVAATAWAQTPHSRAYAADVAVRAYAAAGQRQKCHEMLGHEQAALTMIHSDTPAARWWYFYDESFYWQTEAEYALAFHDADRAQDAIDRSLPLIDPANLHNLAFALLFRCEAYVQREEVTEASQLVGDVAAMTCTKTSLRLNQRIRRLRESLGKWASSETVRQLDERINHCS